MSLAFGKPKGDRKCMNLLKKIYKKEFIADIDYFFLTGLVFLFTLLRIPSLVEPDWYGDEGIYQVIGRALNQGRMLYSGIWDNKPPLLYLLYAMVDGDLFLIRLLSLLFGVASIITFFFVAKNIFSNKRFPVFCATGAFSFLFGLPLLEGNIANAENFMVFPILLSLLFIIKQKSSSSIVLPILSGLLLSIAFLIKIVALFDLCAFMMILFTLRFSDFYMVDIKKHIFIKPKEFIKLFSQETLIILSFLFPVFIVAVYFFINGVLSDFFKAAFSQNVGYVGFENLLKISYGDAQLSIPQGELIIKVALLILAVFVVFLYRSKIGRAGIIIYIWMIFSLFNSFFSGRPYTHYVLVSLPALCLFFGYLFVKTKERVKVFHVFLFLVALLLLRNNFWIYTKIVPYYINYAEFVNANKSVQSYQEFFDRITPRDYEIARFIESNTNENDNVFLVSDSGQIYFLANKLPPGRYIVAYHIDFYKDGIEETKNALMEKTPKFIIVTKEGALANNFLQNYQLRYILGSVLIYEIQK